MNDYDILEHEMDHAVQYETNTGWSLNYNCTDYAVNLWNEITKQNIYPNSGIRSPSELYNILKNAHLIYLPKKNNL